MDKNKTGIINCKLETPVISGSFLFSPDFTRWLLFHETFTRERAVLVVSAVNSYVYCCVWLLVSYIS